jgi:hypothetical protein
MQIRTTHRRAGKRRFRRCNHSHACRPLSGPHARSLISGTLTEVSMLGSLTGSRPRSFQRTHTLRLHHVGIPFLACVISTCFGCGSSTSPKPRNLLSVSVNPATAEADSPDWTLPFTASGTFDQAPTTDDNLTVAWSSSDPTIATIDANSGTATCVAAGGPITITATSGQKHGTAQLSCVMTSSHPASGNCVYDCASTRCGALTGYCSVSSGNACRQVFDPVECPTGRPAGGTMTDSCGLGVDTTRTCSR